MRKEKQLLTEQSQTILGYILSPQPCTCSSERSSAEWKHMKHDCMGKPVTQCPKCFIKSATLVKKLKQSIMRVIHSNVVLQLDFKHFHGRDRSRYFGLTCRISAESSNKECSQDLNCFICSFHIDWLTVFQE